MKKIATIIFACIIGLSMTLAPNFMTGSAYADDQEEVQQDTGSEESSDGDITALMQAVCKTYLRFLMDNFQKDFPEKKYGNKSGQERIHLRR